MRVVASPALDAVVSASIDGTVGRPSTLVAPFITLIILPLNNGFRFLLCLSERV